MSITFSKDETYMLWAIKEAQKAFKRGEVPVGAIIVKNDEIIGRGHNLKEQKKCALYHAEIIALKNACKKAGDWRLNGAIMYVTMEPCAMCAGAIVNHRLDRVVIGVTEPNFGACGTSIDFLNNRSLNLKTEITTNVLGEESKRLLQQFFEERRKKINKTNI